MLRNGVCYLSHIHVPKSIYMSIKENENEKNVTFIKVTSANGLESSSRINIYPRQLPPPEFTKTPELKRVKDELVLNYKLNLQNGLRDESVIKWYRCVKDKDI